jgi:2-O-(6-phospho-alpha-D-mannosyl)-D-glycerate hydrolase
MTDLLPQSHVSSTTPNTATAAAQTTTAEASPATFHEPMPAVPVMQPSAPAPPTTAPMARASVAQAHAETALTEALSSALSSALTFSDPVAGYRFTVVPHTHWDREWYLPFEQFRMRLVRTVEEICDVLEADPRFRTFTLDGQAVILEDVIELRPDLEARLRALLEKGRLVTGPAYVLPDEFLAGSESLVRNFLAGRAVVRRFGGKPMAVGYMPDTFGHVDQLPQLLAGFGLDSFVFWRGLGDEANRFGVAFSWEAPDGTEVTAIRQLGSYGNAGEIGRWASGGVDLAERPDRHPDTAAAQLVRFVTAYRAELDRTPTGELLLCNGADHERIQRALPDLLDHARALHPETKVEIGSYEDYWRRLRPTLGELPVHRGELVGGRDAPVLRGINSARMHLKQAAESAERAILVAETLASLAILAGRTQFRYPVAELGRAWREHLRNLPHDSISGCSVDETHRAMEARFASSTHLAERIRREAIASLAGVEEPWTYRPPRTTAVSVINPLGHGRRAVARIPVPQELLDEPAIVATDRDGRNLQVQVQTTAGDTNALVLIELPGFGATDVRLAPQAEDARGVAWTSAPEAQAITNGILTVTGRPDGTIAVTNVRTGETFEGLHRFEDVADRGDEYNFCPVEFDVPRFAERTGSVRVVASGPVVAELEIALELRLPARLSADRRRRTGEVAVPIKTRVRLTAGSERIEFRTSVDNRAEDHRLRVRFAAPGADDTATVRAEGHFSVVRRPVRPSWTGAGWFEPPQLTSHTSGFVSAGDIVVFGRGLPEYEAVPTHGGLDLALTLLRCVGWLSRDDLSTRPGGAGPTLPTPEAQCQGEHTFEYAFTIASEDLADVAMLRASADYRTPLSIGAAGAQTRGLLSVAGDVVVTALKGAEDGEGMILRVFAPEPTGLSIAADGTLSRARLDETSADGDPSAPLRAGEIRTVRIRSTV